MRRFISIIESAQTTISLDEIYLDDYSALDDDSELINQFVSPSDYSIPMPLKEMSPTEAANRLRLDGEPIMDVYGEHATDDQKEIVQDKIDRFDKNRVVVLNGNMVLDGNHHVVAAIISGKPFKYVDIQEMED